MKQFSDVYRKTETYFFFEPNCVQLIHACSVHVDVEANVELLTFFEC